MENFDAYVDMSLNVWYSWKATLKCSGLLAGLGTCLAVACCYGSSILSKAGCHTFQLLGWSWKRNVCLSREAASSVGGRLRWVSK